jgi:translation initiation factor IF-2
MAVKKNKDSGEILRPPIVTLLGHVDHGKTTLLDAIRNTRIASKEAGGITQSTGASVVKTHEGKEITFIDTPGHAAFEKMRSRGATVADMSILVVAADDGVKPQTKEAIKHIKDAKTPYLVAFTKVDLETSDVEKAKRELEQEEVLFEGRGGNVPFVQVSAKKGKGLNELLETISLLWEVSDKPDKKDKLEAVVIETGKDKRGSTISVVVRQGRVEVGDEVVAEGIEAKVRGLFDHKGKSVRKIVSGYPTLILGFKELPPVGAVVLEKTDVINKKTEKTKRERREVKEGELPVVIKANSQGSLEAVISNLPKDAVLIESGVGDVTKNDIFMAKSSTPNASIFVFESKVPTQVERLADVEGIAIETFDIIYKLFERLEELIKEGKEKIKGIAQIEKSFPYNNKLVAGCRIKRGVVEKGDSVVLISDGEEKGRVRIISIRKQKDEVTSVKDGEECGILFKPQLDFGKGDMLVSVSK